MLRDFVFAAICCPHPSQTVPLEAYLKLNPSVMRDREPWSLSLL